MTRTPKLGRAHEGDNANRHVTRIQYMYSGLEEVWRGGLGLGLHHVGLVHYCIQPPTSDLHPSHLPPVLSQPNSSTTSPPKTLPANQSLCKSSAQQACVRETRWSQFYTPDQPHLPLSGILHPPSSISSVFPSTNTTPEPLRHCGPQNSAAFHLRLRPKTRSPSHQHHISPLIVWPCLRSIFTSCPELFDRYLCAKYHLASAETICELHSSQNQATSQKPWLLT
jgi:hypothetical protein